jgi:hypothetical protein
MDLILIISIEGKDIEVNHQDLVPLKCSPI